MRYAPRWGTAHVRAVELVSDDVAVIRLEPEAGAQPYPPGSHLQVEVLVDGLPQIRHYSLVGERQDGTYRIGVRRQPDGRGGSAYIHALQPGARLRTSEPQNHFALSWGAPEYLLVAGGIGITPLVSMAGALQRRGLPFRLLYAGRSRAAMPFLDELSERLGDRLVVACSDEGTRFQLAKEVEGLHPDGEAYVCGPLRMVEEIRHIWRDAGRPATSLRFETFASSGVHPNEAFPVHVVDTGTELEVPADSTLLDTLTASGVEVIADCLRGECGLCVVDVVSCTGTLDHRDVFLSDEQKAAGDKLCACVSRVVGGGLTIDTGLRPEGARGSAATESHGVPA